MTSTIITKNSSTATSVPSSGSLTQGELAVNVTDKRLFTKDSGGTVVEVGTNPSTMSLPNGTANGVTYLNGSKVLTSGSALTFDGTNLGVGTASPSGASGTTFAINGGAGQTRIALKNTASGDTSTDGFQIALLSDGVNVVYQNRESGYQAWEGNGSELMRLTSTGLGIGTSSPSYKLDIGNATGNSTQLAGTTGGVYIYGIGRNGVNGAEIDSYDAITFRTGSTSGARTGSEKMRLDQSGNLGLGVTPSAWGSGFKALEVGKIGSGFFSVGTDSLQLTNNYYYNGTNYIYAATGYAERYHMVSGQHQWYTAPSGTAGNAITFTQAMTLDASGRLAVGTTGTIISPVTVQATNVNGYGFGIINDATNNTGKLDFLSVSNGGYTRIVGDGRSTGYIAFQTNDTERARIDSSGNLLVGTTSTSFGTQGARMLPSGQVQAVSASGNDAFAGYRQTTTAGDSIITGYSNVGGTQVLKFNAMADGNVRIAAGATYGNISDRKYKTNIVDATPKLQDLMQLRVRNFNVSGSEQKAIGFIAQEFETVFPSLVIESVDKDFDGNDLGTTTKGIKESALLPVLVKAIQELKAEFDAYKATHP